MSVAPVNGANLTTPVQPVGRPQPVQPNALELRDLFARDLAGAAKKLPLGGDKVSAKTAKLPGKPESFVALAGGHAKPPAHKALGEPAEGLARYTGGDRQHGDETTAGLQLFQPGLVQAAPPPMAPMPTAPTVDPSAFADMLTRLWVRERDRQAKEVRVSFGDAAWPATGARLTRLPDGSLSVAVEMGDARGRHGADLEALKQRLSERGLPVSEVEIDHG